jgi:CBS domain-containing protein
MPMNARQAQMSTAEIAASRLRKETPDPQPVYLFMDSPLVRLPTNMTVKGARQVMAWRRAEHCLVSEGGRVLGVISRADLTGAPDTDRAWDWTSRSLSGVDANISAVDALARMERGRVGHLLVSAGPVLLGIVTEARLRRVLKMPPVTLVRQPFVPRFSEGSSTALH